MPTRSTSQTFSAGARGYYFQPLRKLAKVAKLSLELIQQQIEAQQLRILRQKERIAKFDHQNYRALSFQARRDLKRMEDLLALMQTQLAEAH